MARYRKKPVVIDAFEFGAAQLGQRPNWFQDRVATGDIITFATHCVIKTLEGDMRGDVGDWIIQGVKGEIYPCKADIFTATYDAA